MPTLTPADLSLELGVPQKRIRDVLREFFGTLDIGTTRWELSDEQVDAVRDRLRVEPVEIPRFSLSVGDQVLRRAVHRAYGGQQQGGISTPRSLGEIFIFTDPAKGARHGYDRFEGLREDGSYSYTGEGQVGDQVFLRGNLALRDAAKNGRIIRLFTVQNTRVTYIGAFTTGLPTYRYEIIPDNEGTLRRGSSSICSRSMPTSRRCPLTAVRSPPMLTSASGQLPPIPTSSWQERSQHRSTSELSPVSNSSFKRPSANG
ncbi:hypothetical protein MT349_13210 [Rathayibacter caricis]|uniref:hypothetical protein n=1 Tax=Rathayibacter caricis TaxID=110936 RepID=UPI001FB4C489|nr:hypothetical protein [Rathayibacter caricis]MCJ1696736.1 hypothetical protein [Rathayibacter caricis]